jgi:hypothetical protein
MKPSVGRIVHFYSKQRGLNGGINGAGEGPYPAMVTQIFKSGDEIRYVNLKVFPPFQSPFDEGSVSVKDECPDRYWEWPPREAVAA